MLKRRGLVAFIFFALAVLAGFSPAARAQISVSIGQPGFYGRIAIGGYPPPALIYPEPVIVHPAPVMHPPVYLRVPPKHMKKWHRYCHRYDACGERVYFVQDDWYRRAYAPQYVERRYMPPPRFEHRGYYEDWRRYYRPHRYHRDDDDD